MNFWGAAQQLYNDSNIAKTAMDHPYATGAVLGVGSGLAAYGASALATKAIAGTVLESTLTACLFNCSQYLKYGDTTVKLTGDYTAAYLNRLQNQFTQFSEKGINIGEHALNSLNKHGISTEEVINAYNSGQRYFDKAYGNQNLILNGVRIPIDTISNKIINVLDIGKIDPTRFIKL